MRKRKSMWYCALFALAGFILHGCRPGETSANSPDFSAEFEINEIINSAPGVVGVAIISENDTLLFNNGVRFPMMSVFKLHQSLAVADVLKKRQWSQDSLMHIAANEIDRETWSPMLNKYGTGNFNVPISELIRYALEMSDNNASNILFGRIVSPSETDRYVRSIAPDSVFRIVYPESAMKNDHDLSYDNYTSPLSAALLLWSVMTDEITFSGPVIDGIRKDLSQVTTGADRLATVAKEEKGIELFAHKTGSGYRNRHGELIAHNDVGYFRLADGRSYAIAVLIRDFRGNEAEASDIIARIGRIAYRKVK